MSDGWRDKKGRSLINFLVYCPRGTIFMRCIDASAQVKDSQMIFKLLDGFVQEVGPEHVVQVVTDNAPNYVLAGRYLMDKYPTIFWTPCAAHCLDLVLEDIGKLDWVREVIDQARSITKYIYNKTTVLSMMRRFTHDKELLRPVVTRFASHFISFQSLQRCMPELRAMFVSREWHSAALSTKPEGQQVTNLVGNQEFWDRITEICAVTGPLVVVLRLVDGDRPAMGYLYEAMDRAKENIKTYYEQHPYDDNEFGDKYTVFWNIIDQRWDNMLHCPIHAAGALLNPSIFFSEKNSNMAKDPEITKGVSSCICTMVRDSTMRARILKEIEMYKKSIGYFGFSGAIETRGDLSPDVWWTNFGGDTPDLQNLAIRILSQTCSSSGCERNWSAFDKIHSKKRNRYIEASKTRLYNEEDTSKIVCTQAVLVYVFENILKLLHPFIPYVTEEIWQALPERNSALIVADWPKMSLPRDVEAVEKFENLQALIRAVRNARAEYSVEPGKWISATIVAAPEIMDYIYNEKTVLATLARLDLENLYFTHSPPEQAKLAVHLIVKEGLEAYLPVTDMVDISTEIERVSKRLKKLQSEYDGHKKRLKSPSFVEKAPALVVQAVRDKANEAEEKLAMMKSRLAFLESTMLSSSK